jgi:hypothetical protein
LSIAVNPESNPNMAGLAQVCQQVRRLVAEILKDAGAAIVVVSKGRVAKAALALIIGSVAAEVVLGGIGISGLVAPGGIPRLRDLVEQVIDLSGSLGEFVLCSLLSPAVAEIAITGMVILALILYRRWENQRSRARTSQISQS